MCNYSPRESGVFKLSNFFYQTYGALQHSNIRQSKSGDWLKDDIGNIQDKAEINVWTARMNACFKHLQLNVVIPFC